MKVTPTVCSYVGF